MEFCYVLPALFSHSVLHSLSIPIHLQSDHSANNLNIHRFSSHYQKEYPSAYEHLETSRIMGKNTERHVMISAGMKMNQGIKEDDMRIKEDDMRRSLFSHLPKSPTENGRPSSMMIKEERKQIFTIFASKKSFERPNQTTGENHPVVFQESHLRPSGISVPAIAKTQLEPSRLLNILTEKSSFHGNFVSIPEIQARNKVLNHFGLSDEEYCVIFTQNYKDAMMLVGESYPFFKGNFYLTLIGEDEDYVREFASYKESRLVCAPESWLDLRIKGSQLSQYFRRKCKHVREGLFAYPAEVNGIRYSTHWTSEAHCNSWHILLDATALVVGEDRLNLTLHRPDFVLSNLDNTNSHSSKITCLLVRRKSFDLSTASTLVHEQKHVHYP